MNAGMGIFNIDTLARRAGLTRRTVRYYIQRGLLEPPQGGGRGSYYTAEHLRRLERIRAWAEQGVPLLHMKALLESGIEPAVELAQTETSGPVGGPSGAPAPDKGLLPPAEGVAAERAESPAEVEVAAGQAASLYERVVLADGVELHVRRGALPPRGMSPERLERVRKLLMDQEER